MDRQLALARVKVPAIGLIVVGALGLLNALLTMVGGVDEAKLEEALLAMKMEPEQVEQFVSLAGGSNIALSVMALVVSGLIAFGGLQMLKLQGWTLAVISAIAAMIPCFSGCCCLFGLPFGIWALVVLFNGEIKAAFQQPTQ